MRKKLLLVVDDEPDIVKILKTMLEGEGHEVMCGNDGLEVFGLLEQRTPDILIIDRMMPGMNGMEVIRRLKQAPKTSSIPIIMLTSMDKFDDVSEGYKQGADGYIAKPFTKTQIINGINLTLAARPPLSEKDLQTHAAALLKACAKLSRRTEEVAEWFAAEEALSPSAWSYKWLDARLRADQEQTGTLERDPQWHYCFHGWGVDFKNTKTGEQADLAIGPGGRCDSFDEWRVQCYIQNEARRGVSFGNLHAVIEDHPDAVPMIMNYLSRQGWIEPARAQGEAAKKDFDAQLGDRWLVSEKGANILKQS